MMRVFLHTMAMLAAAAFAAAAGIAGQTNGAAQQVANAQLTTKAATGSLQDQIQEWARHAGSAEWLGYAVPQVNSERVGCCNWGGGEENCGSCRLEDGKRGVTTESHDKTTRLEEPRQLMLFYRAENGRVGKIRLASGDCGVDAGGLPVLWLTGVKPEESVAVLKSFALKNAWERHDDMSHSALAAIALHDGEGAENALESFTAPQQPEELRKQATFWLGEARGKAGLDALKRIERSDPSAEVRAQVAFAFSVSHEPEALEEMIRMAHEDESAHVRGQALFWLAQKAGKRAEATITGAIENDPDTEVKKKAVFALSQLPKDDGVPKLIEVAKSNHNRAVRKQAMFWLGQSNDPRALEFFEQVLAQ